MKTSRVHQRFTLLSLLLASTFAFGCDELAAGTTLWIRLTSPVSSFNAHPGDHLSAILTEEVECGGAIVFPAGSQLEGSVRRVHKVGWGIYHETAMLEIAFTHITATPGSAVPIEARVTEVENARERVKNGMIQGIRSTDTPQGRINSRLRHLPTWNPYSDAVLIAFKVGFPVFPEPEIYYGPGTDLRLVLAAPLASPPVVSDVVEVPGFREQELSDLVHLVGSLPERSTTISKSEADLVNLVFLGSREQVESAFQAAGWSRSDSASGRSFLRNFYAFLDDSSYAKAPMRKLLLDDAPSDMNWQKSLNSYAKRDHLRVWEWKEPWGHEPVWVSTSTRDTSATLSLKYHSFVHHISADLDAERAIVLRDLTVAGCVSQMDYFHRPGVPHLTQNATGDMMRTDGAVAVVRLQDCPGTALVGTRYPASQFRAGSRVFRFARRQILTFRSDIWRANIIYGLYDLGRMTVTTLRKHADATPALAEANSDVTNSGRSNSGRRIVAIAEAQDTAHEAVSLPPDENGYVSSTSERWCDYCLMTDVLSLRSTEDLKGFRDGRHPSVHARARSDE